jgi:N-methylhydantoinase B
MVALSGFGVRLDFQVFEPEGLVTARGMERLKFQPWGVNGGRAGQPGRVVLNPDTPRERRLPKIDVLALEPGDVLSIRTPGAGGWGDAFERPPERVMADVRAGLVTPAQAHAEYGVVLQGDEIDERATKELRAERLAPRLQAFDFGPARLEHERVWTAEVYAEFIGILMSLPTSYRSYVRRVLYRTVQRRAQGQRVTPADVRGMWQELRASLPVKRGGHYAA